MDILGTYHYIMIHGFIAYYKITIIISRLLLLALVLYSTNNITHHTHHLPHIHTPHVTALHIYIYAPSVYAKRRRCENFKLKSHTVYKNIQPRYKNIITSSYQ